MFLAENTPEAANQRNRIAGLTLPDSNYTPAIIPQRGTRLDITSDIGRKLTEPKLSACFWDVCVTATMAMPKTAVYKYYGPPTRQYNIGATRQVTPMKPKPKTETVQDFSHNQLWNSVACADPAHVPTAVCFRNTIHS